MYRVSPFLLTNADGTISNLLSCKRVRISAEVLLKLRSLKADFEEADVRSALGVDEETSRRFVHALIDAAILLPAGEEIYRSFAVRYADIEICSHCNARCVYCPVSQDPLPRRFMPDDIFERIISKLADYRPLWVSFNHYNEPLLDPGFLTKARMLAHQAIPLRLFTNGVLLSPRISEELASLGNVEQVVVNLPAQDPEEYRNLMGVKMSAKLLPNIKSAITSGLKVSLCVNGSRLDAKRNKETLEKIFGDSIHPVSTYVNLTHDRAGLLNSSHAAIAGYWGGDLGGCRRYFEHVQINVDGKVFMCCQDYRQQYIIGDLLAQSVEEILAGDEATRLRRLIFGDLAAARDFICRSCIELQRPADLGRARVREK